MKLWYSFQKELSLSAKSWYFYVELGMAVILLLVLLFVIPENFDTRDNEYVYLDLPVEMTTQYYANSAMEDSDGVLEETELKIDGIMHPALYFENDDSKVYYLKSRDAAVAMAEKEQKFSAIISLKDGRLAYEYFLQGYESDRLKNLFLILHNSKMTTKDLEAQYAAQRVVSLEQGYIGLNDREMVLPIFLTFNGSLMGVFMIAAYIFLDKKEGIIKAYAVTASSVWQYLFSKVSVIVVTSILSSLILVLPIMGFGVNYGLLILFLIASGFFATCIGLVLSSYYKDITQSFGGLFVIIAILMMPNVAYFIPSWEPAWLKFIPSWHMIQSFKEILLPGTDVTYVLLASLGFVILSIPLFLFSDYRFQKTITA